MSDAKKKIAYLLEYPLDLPGGAQMSTESLCVGLLNTEFEPVVICPHLLKKKESDYPFKVVTYDMGEKRIQNLLIRRKAFKEIINREKPDIVHVQMPESLITYGIAGIKGPEMIFTDRGLFYGYRKHSMLLMKFALKKARLLLTTTDFNKKMWEEGSRIRPIEKVANTISDKFTAFDENLKEKAIARNNGVLTVGLAGRICDEKDWPFAVKLIEEIARQGIKIKLKLVLSVFEKGDDEKVADIIKGIGTAIGEENLEFHQDYSQQEMQEYYYGLDVFIMTSKFESFGKAAVEAMSRRCAVISTDVGGLSEVIGTKDNLYTVQTMEKAVDYIRRVSEDREFLATQQEYFYNRFRENFSQERCINDHLGIYKGILGIG